MEVKEAKRALINRNDQKREKLQELGMEFEDRIKALGYKTLGVHYRGTDTADVMLVSIIVADEGFDTNREDGMNWAYEFKDYYDNHVFPWEKDDEESGSKDSAMVQD